ncbi:MAG: PilN domain-containing protein [Candidatus Moraniibacteriota bacterium]
MKISLDLLPQNKKDEIKRNKLFRELLREEIFFLFPLLILIIILVNVNYLLSIQRSSSQAAYEFQQNQDKYQELDKYDAEFKNINNATSLLLKVQNGHLRWANVFSHLGQAIPSGIAINNFANKNYVVSLAGKALTRNKLLEFKGNLEKDACFGGVNVPLSDLVVKENVDFQLDFNVTQECLRSEK